MASQVIMLPANLFRYITEGAWVPQAQAFGLKGMFLLAQRQEKGIRMIRVLGRPDGVAGNPFVDTTCLLTIHSGDQPPGFAPPILPEALALDTLDKTKVALLSLDSLNAHDQMVIIEAFERAREAAPVPRQQRTRLPHAPYETTLLARASAIHGTMAPAFSQLAGQLASYRKALGAGDNEVAVSRLDLQAELGVLLTLRHDDGRLTPDLKAPSRRGNLNRLARGAHNALEVSQDIAEMLHRADIADRHWLDADSLSRLHARLLAGTPASRQAGKLRQGPAATRSPFGGGVTEVAVSAQELPVALSAFAEGFDLGLWRDIHPVIRAAMAHTELVRLHPCADGNGRLARQLMLGMLLEAGLPVMPIVTILEWNRHHYLYYVDHAVTRGDDLAWAQFLMKVVGRAMKLGATWSAALAPDLVLFETALQPEKLNPIHARRVALLAVTSLLGTDPQARRWGINEARFEWYLNRAGLCDMVAAGDLDIGGVIAERQSEVLWSHALARFLLSCPPARL